MQSLLIEPFYRKLVRWEAVVVSTAEDGPVSLVPAEVEHYNVLQELEDADLALKEWQMMQVGHCMTTYCIQFCSLACDLELAICIEAV